MKTKQNRQGLILDIISENTVETQEQLIEKLAEAGLSELPVVMIDERMTTMAASRYLNETDTRGQKRKSVIDTLSAEIILQNALDKLKNMKN